MSDATYNITQEDLRKMESKESKSHGGQINKDSDVAKLKQIIAERDPEQERIDRTQANLELPEQPLGGKAPEPDFNSADARTVNVGSGGVNVKIGTNSSSGLREPATGDSSVRTDGEEWKTNTALGN